MNILGEEVGIVIIGRNEGERLKQCLASVINQTDKIVYVDSGSSDGSVEYVEHLGIEVVRLDMTIPFSAARARNEGFRELNHKNKNLKFIQFIDGDCQCSRGWLSSAYTYLQENESFAVVSGRRKEKYPQKSIYNMLCDIEWNTPIGDAKACGGDFMIRIAAFEQINGFNPTVISGEEPEMCYRLRGKNWSIYRLDHPMTIHDADITRFSQWWKRCLRAGHAYAQGFLLHARDGRGYCFKESVRIWFWACIFPACVLILTISVNTSFILLLSVYLLQFVRISLRMYKQLKNIKLSLIYSYFIIIGKWSELCGQLLFYLRKFSRKKYTIIEYN